MMAHELNKISNILRARIIENSSKTKTPHLGSCLSCIDILIVLYWKILNIYPENHTNINRDHFILSKGHAAPALFHVLSMKGFFPEDWLKTYGGNGSFLGEHPPAHGVPGIEAATGSLGHGLSLGVGFAIGSRINKISNRVFVLMSDGECNEGSVWEAALFAAAQKLNHLRVIIDFNKWQATGRSEEVMSLKPLCEKWKVFGWEAHEIDGHNYFEIEKALLFKSTQKPVAIIAHTVKGKGVSFMEDDNNWHYRIPTLEEVAASKIELGIIEELI